MTTIASIIGTFYQDLLATCEKRKISLNLDLQNPSLCLKNEEQVSNFLKSQISFVLKACKAGDRITIAQSANEKNDILLNRISVKFSGRTITADEKQKLLDGGYEVRARFGYDTIITLRLAQ